jgi:acyl dehydratase
MTQESVISDELRGYVGYETEPVKVEIDRTLIARYAEGIDDSNPLWLDSEAAKNGPYGTLVAPPALFATVMMRGKIPWDEFRNLLPAGYLDGGGEWEVFELPKLGDTIAVSTKVVDLSERQGRSGAMVLLTVESTWRNQKDKVVAKAKSTTIFL